jgi:hypothetical protein
MRLRSLPVLVVCLAVLEGAGCYSLQIARPGTLPTAGLRVPPEQRMAAWNRAITALIDAGFVPQVFNETACYVSARRRDDLDDDVLIGALAIVQVTPEGLVRVQISGRGSFRSPEDLQAEIQRRQSAIVQAIARPPS